MPKKKKPSYTQAQKDKAFKWIDDGMTQAKVAEKLGCHPLTVYGWLRAQREAAENAPKKKASIPPKKKRAPAKAGAVRSSKKNFLRDLHGQTTRGWKAQKMRSIGLVVPPKYNVRLYIHKPPYDASNNLLTWDQAEAQDCLRFSASKISKSGSDHSFARFSHLDTAIRATIAHSKGQKLVQVRKPKAGVSSATVVDETGNLSVLKIFSQAEEAFARLIGDAASNKDYEQISILSKWAQKFQEIKESV